MSRRLPLVGLVIALMLPRPATAQVGVVIHGRVEDAYTRQPVAGARVFVPSSADGVLTDERGVFALLLPSGAPLSLQVELFGYVSQRFDLDPSAPSRVSVLLLEPSPFELEGVTVVEESALTELLSDLRGRRNFLWGTALDRAQLERYGGASVWTVVRSRAPMLFECNEALSGLCARSRATSFVNQSSGDPILVCVDGWPSWGAVSELDNLDVRDVALLEVYQMGRGGIRVYTPRYLATTARRGGGVSPFDTSC